MGAVGEAGCPGNEWRTADDWPVPPTATPYYLHADRHADASTPRILPMPATTFLADPLHPNAIPGTGFPGAADAQNFEKQAEVRTFTTRSPDRAGRMDRQGAGRAVRHLVRQGHRFHRPGQRRLSRRPIDPDHRLRPPGRYRDGYEKEVFLEPGKVYKVAFDVGWLSQIFNKGHRIRVTVASTGAPFFEPNPNTGEPLAMEPLTEKNTVVAKNTVYLNKEHASRIIAPVVK